MRALGLSLTCGLGERRRPSAVWRSLLTSVLAGSAMLVAGCSAAPWSPGAAPRLDTSGLAASVQEVVGMPVTVTCPDNIPIQAGLVSECVVSDGQISKVLVVTQTDDQGKWDWQISERDAPAG